MMRFTRLVQISTVAALAFTLAGCTINVTQNGSAEDIANLAEDALEQQIGQRPEIDCGEESIPLIEDSTITCLLIDPATGAEFDADITLTSVEGNNVNIYVKVADNPRP